MSRVGVFICAVVGMLAISPFLAVPSAIFGHAFWCGYGLFMHWLTVRYMGRKS